MAREKKEKKDDDGAEVPGWVVTYGDMMSLLLCFFVLLLSFSTISDKDFEKAVASLRGNFGVLPKNLSALQINMMPRPTTKSLERTARNLRRRLQKMGKEKDVKVEFDQEGGLKIELPSKLLFESAKADVRPGAFALLDVVGDLFKDLPGAVFEVAGHTDNQPLRSNPNFKDNHDLSYGRAKAVTDYLCQKANIPMDQFNIVACGPTKPKASNDTPEGRQANRRVEIYVRGDVSQDEMEAVREVADDLTRQYGE